MSWLGKVELDLSIYDVLWINTVHVLEEVYRLENMYSEFSKDRTFLFSLFGVYHPLLFLVSFVLLRLLFLAVVYLDVVRYRRAPSRDKIIK